MKKLGIFLCLVIIGLLLVVTTEAAQITEIFLCQPVTGDLSHDGDRDYYKLYINEGEHLFVNLENHPGQDLRIQFYIKYGEVPPEAGWDDYVYVLPGEEGILDINPTQSGYYYITTIANVGPGSYTIHAYDETLFAQILLKGQPVTRDLSHDGDRDYYKLYINEGEHLFVNLENHPDQDLRVYFYIKYGEVPPEAGWDDYVYVLPGEEGILEINPTQSGYYYITTIANVGPGSYTVTAIEAVHPPFPIIDITLNKDTFHSGDILIATAHITNGSEAVDSEVKLWIELPNNSLFPVFNSHYVFTVKPNAEITKEVFRRTFTGSEPSGDYVFGGRLENPITGADFSTDSELFSFTP